jgi:signal transduction histidine kinase
MTERSARRLAWAIWLAGMAMFLGVFAFRLIRHESFQRSDITEPLAFAAVGVVGLIVAIHQPRNAIGWIYLVVWIFAAGLFAVVQEYASWVETTHASAPGEPIAVWLGNWTWVPIFTLLLTYPFLLFPDGHLPSPRWRPVALAIALTSALWSITFALNGGSDYTNANNEPATNPFAAPASIASAVTAARIVLSFVMIGLMAATVASLLLRYRRSHGDEREQIRWLMLAGGATVFWFILPLNHGVGGWADFLQGFVLALIPIAIGVAILKYRLYDIDLVLRKTLVFGVLAVFITAVYVAVVVGLGSLFTDTLFLRIAATALVAVAFQPVRDRANRIANRLVFGERATPYEVLARFGERVGETYASDDVLPRIARVIAEGTAAARSDVWLRLGDRLTLAASWPVAEPRSSFAIERDELPPIEADRVAAVRHQGELLGAIAVTKPPSEPLAAGDAELVDRLAEQAGLVLANARLTADLEARLMQIAQQAADLRSSRQRIVAAQDEERRRLERNIHDGAQQHLVALAVKLRLAKTALQRDPELGRRMLEEIQGEVDAALDTLRSLALGIYPPLLEEEGIAAALAAQYVRSSLPVRMEADGIGRYPIELEAAIYFCALEALQNATKYANATAITIAFREHDGALEFSVADDGGGFDPGSNGMGTGIQGMRDRMAVFGGDAEIESSPGHGTIVRGRVPVSERVR